MSENQTQDEVRDYVRDRYGKVAQKAAQLAQGGGYDSYADAFTDAARVMYAGSTAQVQDNMAKEHRRRDVGQPEADTRAPEPDEAIATLSDVVTRVPGDWRALSALGIAHDVTGDPEKAQTRYNAALVVSPNAVSVLNNLALSLTLSGNLAGGIKTLERAARLHNAGVQVRQNLALLYAMKGDLNAAERLLKRDLSTRIVQHNLRYYQLINPTTTAASSSSSTVTNSGATNAQLPVLAITSQPPSVPTVTTVPVVIEKREIDVAVLPPAVTVVVDGFMIELGAFTTRDAAISGSSQLRNTHNDLLGGLRFTIVQIGDGGDAGNYRVRVGPVASEFVAADLCTKIHSNNQPCLLIAP